MINTIIAVVVILFAYINYKWPKLALPFFFALLPTYLLRTNLNGFPTTLLEICFFVLLIFWLGEVGKSNSGRFSIFRMFRNIFELKKDFFSRYKALSLSIILFSIAATFSIFTSVDTRAAAGEWKAFYIEPVILAFIVWSQTKKKGHESSKVIRGIIGGMLLSGFVAGVYAIFQHFTGIGVPYDFWEKGNSYRVTAWYGFPNGVGIYLAPLFVLSLTEPIKQWKESKKVTLVLLVPVVILLAILFAKSTGGLVAVLSSTLLLLFLNKKIRKYIWALGIIGFVILILLPSDNNLKQELLLQDRSGQIRLQMWDDTMQFLKTSPIKGAGLASYEERIVPFHSNVNGEGIEIFHHPHNIFLTMWVNTGLFGLLAFVLVVVSAIIEFSKKKRPLTSQVIFCSFVAIVITGLVDLPILKNDLAFQFWGILILTTSSLKLVDK